MFLALLTTILSTTPAGGMILSSNKDGPLFTLIATGMSAGGGCCQGTASSNRDTLDNDLISWFPAGGGKKKVPFFSGIGVVGGDCDAGGSGGR